MERVEIKTSQLWLASYLSRFYPVEYADFEISIGRPNSPAQVRRFQRKVRDFLEHKDFDMLALSCWTSLSYQATLTVARICRKLYPDKLIVVGGYHPSARPDEFVTEDRLIDYVICGEGELALQEIAAGFEPGKRPSETKVVKAPPLAADSFVRYDWSLVDGFVNSHFSEGIVNLYLYLSRGCPFNCSFCMEPLKDRSWRAFSPEMSVEELFGAAERFRANVGISDACFGMRPAWRKVFLKKLVDAKPSFWVVVETRPEYLDEEDIKLLSQLKVEIQFGIESCSPEMLLLMKKTRQPEKFLERFRQVSHMLSDHGILHRANLIFNHPGETRKTLEETFAFIDEELKRQGTYLMWACHGYMHFPGCELDTNKRYYEETYGSRFLSPAWWRENEDQYENSMRFVPSQDLDGENVDLWKRMLADRDEQLKSTLAPRAFKFASHKYFMHWKNDPRYHQN
jgi:radical SAM superfamily enzyme YgiQ (UPF0313 family)